MNDISHSKKMNAILIILGSIAVVFVVFALGVYVGYRKAIFASGRSDNYYRDFLGGTPPAGVMGFTSGMPGDTHGVIGTVIDIGSSSVVVEDANSDEESVVISSGTVIRMQNETIGIDGFTTGEGIVVIGEPNDSGQIEAHFVRVFPATSSFPASPPVTPMSNTSNEVIIQTL